MQNTHHTQARHPLCLFHTHTFSLTHTQSHTQTPCAYSDALSQYASCHWQHFARCLPICWIWTFFLHLFLGQRSHVSYTFYSSSFHQVYCQYLYSSCTFNMVYSRNFYIIKEYINFIKLYLFSFVVKKTLLNNHKLSYGIIFNKHFLWYFFPILLYLGN